MLKIVRTAYRTCQTLACCLLLAPLSTAEALAQTEPATTSPLLSQDAFAALAPEDKYIYLQGVTADWTSSANGADFAFLHTAVDTVVAPTGSLRVPVAQSLPFGQAILLTYRVTQNPIYYQAARQLRVSLQPQQDKADMAAAPFLADFGVTAQDASAADQASDILLQIDTTQRDLETGLLHGTSPVSDLSRNSLYALDLLQVIDRLPLGFHHRRGLTEALNKTLSALMARQKSGEMWQSPTQPAKFLFLDAYIVAHGVRLGTFAQSDASLADRMMQAAHSATLTAVDEGARLLAQSEEEQVATQAYGQGKTVMIDAWFNADTRVNAAGKKELFHYKWDDDADTGFSFLGYAFERYGVQLDTLRVAPTAASLNPAQIYFIVAPYAAAESASHQITKASGDAIESWVRQGGVLVLMSTDAETKDFTELNSLSDRFGMHFDAGTRAAVSGPDYERGAVTIAAGTSVFQAAHHAFMDDVCTLKLGPLAHPVARIGGNSVIAIASIGRGTVLAVADPWVYNEFTDGRTLPHAFDNFAAAIDLAGSLLKQTQQ